MRQGACHPVLKGTEQEDGSPLILSPERHPKMAVIETGAVHSGLKQLPKCSVVSLRFSVGQRDIFMLRGSGRRKGLL